MQDALRILSDYWTSRGCLTWQPFNTEVGAGTMNPATVLRVLGPEPWDVAYVEPSVRPDDARYGENPNRLQMHTQFQVILKPEPGDPQELYLGSLEALGIDLDAHDVRFVEDNWAQPAIGAWGLGWEVWLDGMEITQFTYFQQVGGQDLNPIPVELTYGLERILMAQQGVTHFTDIAYSRKPDGTVVTYGEAFGQQEYEMSRYYLDDADVEANKRLYEAYVSEATRMVEARLPVPAHQYILKSSHAFNVLDARGAISTTERAQAFGTMRRLMRDTAALWIERREELGFPLLKAAEPVEPEPREIPEPASEQPQTFALEIGVEELPPHVVAPTVEQVRAVVTESLAASRLGHGEVVVAATPRRIALTVAGVAALEEDATTLRKGPKWAAAFDAEGNPTKPLQGFMRGQGVTLEQVVKAEVGGAEHACVAVETPGRSALEVLGGIVEAAVFGLRAEKNMRWCDPKLSFSRAIRWVLALWGEQVVPARISGLVAGRSTYLQRTTAATAEARRRADGVPVGVHEVASADELLPTIARGGIILDFEARRAAVVEQATRLAEEAGGVIDLEANAGLLDEITNLVEEPVGVLGTFDERYLELPDRILVQVMAKHQRYLPIRDAQGRLMARFVTLANGSCNRELVARGNESVLRARYEDALFFWNQDLEAEGVDQFVPGLEQLTFENRLGSMGLRARRIAAVAQSLSEQLGLDEAETATLRRAGELAKFDLATKLVTEMTKLAGFVAREYAQRKGETQAVADALYEMEQPHTTADEVPRSRPGALLALGDRFDLLMAMFALGAKPSGSSDPYGLRRAALGVVRILREDAAFTGVSVRDGLLAAAEALRGQGVEVSEDAVDRAEEFVIGRFAQLMRDEGRSAELVAAVLPSAGQPADAAAKVADLEQLIGDPQWRRIVEALVRIQRIVPEGTEAAIDREVLEDAAEKTLAAAVADQEPSREVSRFATVARELVQPITEFFAETLVMAEEPGLRAARLGLLASVAALAPRGLDWAAIDTATKITQ
ncbi:MAG: glycine--tRNA ligase [Propionibacteriaceae bacterium]|nr:glycine--tRNA ligase [Propionibacteriaceae bacterium]